jgi:hypothetical protein
LVGCHGQQSQEQAIENTEAREHIPNQIVDICSLAQKGTQDWAYEYCTDPTEANEGAGDQQR